MQLMTAQSTTLLCLSATLVEDPIRLGGQCGMCGHVSEGGRLCREHEVGGTGGDGVGY